VLVGISGFSSYAYFTSEVTSPNEIRGVVVEKKKLLVDIIKSKEGQDGLRKIEQAATTQMSATTEYRYSGDNNSVNNYINFNNETWRIIGVFEVEDENGNKEERVKIIREKPLDILRKYGGSRGRWINYPTDSNYSYYYLNYDYYNTISETYKKLIGQTKYYLGGSSSYSSTTANQFYTIERGAAHNTSYPQNVVANIGLMYASDYGYAADSSCDSAYLSNFSTDCYSKDWLYTSVYTKGSGYTYTGTSTVSYEWFLTANTSSATSSVTTYYANSLSVTAGSLVRRSYSSNYLMRPTLYLKSDASIDSGNGTKEKPYRLDLGHPSNVSILQSTTSENTEKLWGHKSDITKIIFQDELKPIDGAKETWDLSDSSVPANSVMGYLVTDPDDSAKNIAYVQGKGGVYANPDSSNLFYGFKKLTTIEGMEYFNTSKVTNMSNMFGASMFSASALISLDLSNFDTSKVTDMSNMFSNTSALTSLDLSNFDTSKVTNMAYMFNSASALTSLDVSGFDTSNVTNMGGMFLRATSLVNLDFRKAMFDKVTSYSAMFRSVPSNIKITTKNGITKTWLQSRLSEESITGATFNTLG